MLSATFVKNVNVPGRYGDGRGGLGLTLRVKPASRGGYCKSWAQSIRINGRKTTIGLGAYPVTTLAMARERAVENARSIALGRDPRRASNGVPTFARAAETVIAIHAENWRAGSRSEEGWRSSLRDYAMPRLGDKRVDAVTTGDVMAVLLPIWSTKRETARRLRHRIGAVMKWAVAQGYRSEQPGRRRHLRRAAEERCAHRAPESAAARRGGRRAWQGTHLRCPSRSRAGVRVPGTDGRALGGGARPPARERSTATPQSGRFPPSA